MYRRSRTLFLRLLGAVYFAAFASAHVQLPGLVGERGILPAGEALAEARRQLGAGFLDSPTLFWFGASDSALRAATLAGCAFALLLVFDLVPLAALLACWVLYRSVVEAGSVFFGYQWDALLLEAGFLALFFAPLALRSSCAGEPHPGARLMLWALVFKLMFLSGVVKLASGDPTWRNLTALDYHFWTQPLPLPTAWPADALPDAIKAALTFAMYAIELGAPLLMFFGRSFRLASAVALLALQLGIAATGNYGFFNLLSAVLLVPLADDRALFALVPARLRRPIDEPLPVAHPKRSAALWAVTAVVLALNLPLVLQWVLPRPETLQPAYSALAPLEVFNSYGLFAVMTRERREIALEGSDDGAQWRRYRFRYKPDDPLARPRVAVLHLPRLDWQLWFAALGDCQDNAWMLGLFEQLLRGSPTVSGLFEEDPFAAKPPRFLRTRIRPFHMLHGEAAWWSEGAAQAYCPTVTLEDGQLAAVPGR